MPRIPQAAKQLVKQVREIDPDITATTSHPDGFRINRVVRFTGPNLSWLHESLVAIGDNRIDYVDLGDDEVVIGFVATVAADKKDPFPIEAAQVVSQERSPSEASQSPDTDSSAVVAESVTSEGEPKPAKKAAKRTTKKAAKKP